MKTVKLKLGTEEEATRRIQEYLNCCAARGVTPAILDETVVLFLAIFESTLLATGQEHLIPYIEVYFNELGELQMHLSDEVPKEYLEDT